MSNQTVMQTYNVADINALSPCKPATNWVAADWTGTLADILCLPQVSYTDKIWVFGRLGTDKQCRLFAVWCARQALSLVAYPDPRSVAACDVAERFAHGHASKSELQQAAAAADAAAYAADAASAYAAWSVAAYAAWIAAYAAKTDAKAAAKAVANAAAYDAKAAAKAASLAAQINYAYHLVTGEVCHG